MAGYHLSDEEWIAEWKKIGSPQKFAQIHKQDVRSIYNRRRSLETRLGIELPTFNDARVAPIKKIQQTEGHVRRGIDLEKGRIVVFSDAHFWPDITTTAFKSLIEGIKEHKPSVIVANGDCFDGSGLSRFPRMDFDKLPSVKEELEACQHYLGEIEKVAKGAKLIWTMGNHDQRFLASVVQNLPAFEGVPGTHLKDYFPMWNSCWSFWVNEDTCIKHRHKGSFGATRANPLAAGLNMITGHTHHLSVFPVADYSGTRWGCQTGTLADVNGPQFSYTEDSVKDWNSGWALLSFERKRLLMPEIVRVWGEDEVEFRGKIHAV